MSIQNGCFKAIQGMLDGMGAIVSQASRVAASDTLIDNLYCHTLMRKQSRQTLRIDLIDRGPNGGCRISKGNDGKWAFLAPGSSYPKASYEQQRYQESPNTLMSHVLFPC
jgi:hypothetical protein